MKQNTATVAKIGFDNGSITFKNTWNVFAPSILAASSNSFGIEEKNWMNKKILKIEIDAGKIIDNIGIKLFNPSIV